MNSQSPKYEKGDTVLYKDKEYTIFEVKRYGYKAISVEDGKMYWLDDNIIEKRTKKAVK